MKFSFKFPRGSTVLLALLLLVTLSLEQAFVLPILTLMILFVQQPLLSDVESSVLAGILGLLFAVVFHVPIAFGVGVVLLGVALSRTVFQQAHVQARDAALTIAICAAMAWALQFKVTVVSLGQFFVYFMAVIVLLRLWVSRRSYHAKRTKISS